MVREGGSFLKHQANVARHFVGDRLPPVTAPAPEDLTPGDGAVIRVGARQCAVHRYDNGQLHAVSARCTHLGCLVAFNRAEQAWECPCHGSRFAPDGSILQGPAVRPLERARSSRPDVRPKILLLRQLPRGTRVAPSAASGTPTSPTPVWSRPVKALVVNRTLKKSPQPSNTEALASVIAARLAELDVKTESVRPVDLAVAPGVVTDAGDGDEWPGVHDRLLDAEILVIASPTWRGRPSPVAQRVLERMDAMMSGTDDEGRP
jgi:nitrite reductase/ring-hydroxylating ferredoxin subunit